MAAQRSGNSHYRTIGTICINRDGRAPGGQGTGHLPRILVSRIAQ
jgi:hypothetical protein